MSHTYTGSDGQSHAEQIEMALNPGTKPAAGSIDAYQVVAVKHLQVGYLILASAELYDPAKGTWTATGSMPNPRHGNTATLLANGKVLVAGGHGITEGISTPLLARAELYDPTNPLFSRDL